MVPQDDPSWEDGGSPFLRPLDGPPGMGLQRLDGVLLPDLEKDSDQADGQRRR